MTVRDCIVVGAGFGGLSAAAVLARRGQDVLLLEGAGELGGCAGKFDRGGYRFAVGATLGMGFEPEGTLHDLYGELGLPLPKLNNLPVIMDVHLPDRSIRYWREKERWYAELARLFPNEQGRMIEFYEEVFRVAELVQQNIAKRPLLPPVDWQGWRKLFGMIHLDNVKLLPFISQSITDRLRKYDLLGHKPFYHFLYGQLIDAVQTSLDRCPAFLGYTALNVFHRGAFYVYGGLATVADDLAGSLRSSGGELKMRSRVVKIAKSGGVWDVTTSRGETYQARNLILNNSLHSLHGMLDPELAARVKVKQDDEESRQAWGAFALYLGCREEGLQGAPSDSLFHQFVGAYDQGMSEGNQFLLSISAADDRLRTEPGHRALTMTTHIDVAPWWNRADYERLKEQYTERLLSTASRQFPALRQAVEVTLPGTPVTWQRFTGRAQGKVGGYALHGKLAFLQAYSPYSGVEGLWFCGDTVFPGAGTLATALSGWIVADQIRG